MKGFERIWYDLRGCGKIWKDLIGFERIWKDLKGFEKIWKDLRGFERIWKDLRGFEDLNGFEMIWKDFIWFWIDLKKNERILYDFELIWEKNENIILKKWKINEGRCPQKKIE